MSTLQERLRLPLPNANMVHSADYVDDMREVIGRRLHLNWPDSDDPYIGDYVVRYDWFEGDTKHSFMASEIPLDQIHDVAKLICERRQQVRQYRGIA